MRELKQAGKSTEKWRGRKIPKKFGGLLALGGKAGEDNILNGKDGLCVKEGAYRRG